jgi:hypothetical protein
MTLKASLTALTEVADAFREHYVERDGRWVLQTDPPTEDVTGLKSALEKERGLKRDAERQLSDLKTTFAGIDPAEVTDMREKLKAIGDKKVYDDEGLEALVTRRTHDMQQEHARKVAAQEREVQDWKQKHGALDHTWRRDRIETGLLRAITAAGVAKDAVPDAVSRGLGVFTDLDDKGQPVAKQGDEIRYGKDGVNPLTPEEWIASLKPTAAHLWPASKGSGGGDGNGTAGGGIDYSKLSPTERLTRFREQQAAQTG